jgi:hypothetical protein
VRKILRLLPDYRDKVKHIAAEAAVNHPLHEMLAAARLAEESARVQAIPVIIATTAFLSRPEAVRRVDPRTSRSSASSSPSILVAVINGQWASAKKLDPCF